jgi:hypothetical protein
MSPIRISPEREVYISSSQILLDKTAPTIESRVVRGEVYLLPVGKTQDYIVQVNGFPHAAGGILLTERLTSGHIPDYIMLTTSDNPELSGELGVTAIKIDGVIYEATNVENED